MESAGDRKEAEQDLAQRAQRRKELEIRPLDPVAREGYAQRWRRTQEWFVDNPNEAVEEADGLVQQVMRDRGYPTGDFGQPARDVPVDQPDVVSDYHAAHEISVLNGRQQSLTEQLREAMVRCGTLLAEPLDDGDSAMGRAAEQNVPGR